MHRYGISVLVVAIILATAPVLCSGAPWSINIASGFTSVDYSGLPSTVNDASDAHWSLIPPGSTSAQPARVCTPGGGNFPPSEWAANSPESAWIALSATNYLLGAGTYPFLYYFNVGADVIPTSLMLSGSIGCDNACNLLLNGVSISPRWNNQYFPLAPFTINISSLVKAGAVNVLSINFTDAGLFNGVRIQGSISGLLPGYWSMTVATGWTSSNYSGALSTIRNAADANWLVTPPNAVTPQPARLCMPIGGNFAVGSWINNGPDSNWVAVSGLDYTPGFGGPYYFTTNFTIPAGTDPWSLSFAGALSCDNYCNLLLNGWPISPTYISPFPTLAPFACNASVGWIIGGLNVLTFNLTDAGTYNGIRLQGVINGKLLSSSSSSSSSSSPSSTASASFSSSVSFTSTPVPFSSSSISSATLSSSSSSSAGSASASTVSSTAGLPVWPVVSTAGAAGSDSGDGGSAGVIVIAVIIPLVVLAGIAAFAYYYKRHSRQDIPPFEPAEQLSSNGRTSLLSYSDAHFGIVPGPEAVLFFRIVTAVVVFLFLSGDEWI